MIQWKHKWKLMRQSKSAATGAPFPLRASKGQRFILMGGSEKGMEVFIAVIYGNPLLEKLK